MTFGSRPKGSKGELEVAEILRKWWDPFCPGVIFKRVPLSGGWGDANAREAFKAAGDITCSDARWPFALEVKRREGFSWKPLLAGRASPVWTWWRQTVKQGLEMKSRPMLWFRKNREPWRVMIPFRVGKALLLKGPGGPTSPKALRVWYPTELAVDYGGVFPMLMDADEALRFSPQQWREACAWPLDPTR